MANRILLESPVFNLHAALKAYQYGVDRLELCSCYPEGGCTPSPGLFTYLKSRISIPIFVMIRPRGGHFTYSENELDLMKEEIRLFSNMGADGFVFGVLNSDGSVNKEACVELRGLCSDKPCTFHRAFDVSFDLNQAVEDIVECGFQRILTSGGEINVTEGLSVIESLMRNAGDEIIIMPGGGLNPELVQFLKKTGCLKEIHASCKTKKSHTEFFKKGEINFSGDILKFDETLSVDEEKVKKFKRIL